MTVTNFPTAPAADDLEARYDAASLWLSEYMFFEGHVTAPLVSREMNRTEREVLLFLMGKFPRRSLASMLDTVEAFRASVAERRADKLQQPHFVMTSAAEAIFEAISDTVLMSRIGIISGDSGVGKSETLARHEVEVPSARLVVLDPYRAAAPELLRAMLAAIEHPFPGLRPRRAALLDALVQHTKGTRTYFLVDNAQYLGDDAIEVLRCFHDRSGVPLILAFEEGRIEGALARSRFGSRCSVVKSISTDTLNVSDVTLVAQQILGADLTAGCAAALLEHVRQPGIGALRHLVNVVHTAQAARKQKNRPLTRDDLREAIQKLATPKLRRTA